MFEEVCSELRAGSKRSHWMWFTLLQMKGLGHSSMATYYAISGLQEAKAYLQHQILGPRLVECCELVTAIRGRPIEEVFGQLDSSKFHSSITLFAQAIRFFSSRALPCWALMHPAYLRRSGFICGQYSVGRRSATSPKKRTGPR